MIAGVFIAERWKEAGSNGAQLNAGPAGSRELGRCACENDCEGGRRKAGNSFRGRNFMEIDASGNKSPAITSSASRKAGRGVGAPWRMERREDLPIPLRLHLRRFRSRYLCYEDTGVVALGKLFGCSQSNLPMNINAKGNAGADLMPLERDGPVQTSGSTINLASCRLPLGPYHAVRCADAVVEGMDKSMAGWGAIVGRAVFFQALWS